MKILLVAKCVWVMCQFQTQVAILAQRCEICHGHVTIILMQYSDSNYLLLLIL